MESSGLNYPCRTARGRRDKPCPTRVSVSWSPALPTQACASRLSAADHVEKAGPTKSRHEVVAMLDRYPPRRSPLQALSAQSDRPSSSSFNGVHAPVGALPCWPVAEHRSPAIQRAKFVSKLDHRYSAAWSHSRPLLPGIGDAGSEKALTLSRPPAPDASPPRRPADLIRSPDHSVEGSDFQPTMRTDLSPMLHLHP